MITSKKLILSGIICAVSLGSYAKSDEKDQSPLQSSTFNESPTKELFG